jgi:hypothetical protein
MDTDGRDAKRRRQVLWIAIVAYLELYRGEDRGKACQPYFANERASTSEHLLNDPRLLRSSVVPDTDLNL